MLWKLFLPTVLFSNRLYTCRNRDDHDKKTVKKGGLSYNACLKDLLSNTHSLSIISNKTGKGTHIPLSLSVYYKSWFLAYRGSSGGGVTRVLLAKKQGSDSSGEEYQMCLLCKLGIFCKSVRKYFRLRIIQPFMVLSPRFLPLVETKRGVLFGK